MCSNKRPQFSSSGSVGNGGSRVSNASSSVVSSDWSQPVNQVSIATGQGWCPGGRVRISIIAWISAFKGVTDKGQLGWELIKAACHTECDKRLLIRLSRLTYLARLASINLITSGAFGFVRGSKRAITLPSRSSRNFSKFQETLPFPLGFVSWLVRCL